LSNQYRGRKQGSYFNTKAYDIMSLCSTFSSYPLLPDQIYFLLPITEIVHYQSAFLICDM
jgi:hypothetical protein